MKTLRCQLFRWQMISFPVLRDWKFIDCFWVVAIKSMNISSNFIWCQHWFNALLSLVLPLKSKWEFHHIHYSSFNFDDLPTAEKYISHSFVELKIGNAATKSRFLTFPLLSTNTLMDFLVELKWKQAIHSELCTWWYGLERLHIYFVQYNLYLLFTSNQHHHSARSRWNMYIRVSKCCIWIQFSCYDGVSFQLENCFLLTFA